MTSEDSLKIIVEVLKNHPEGLTITSLAELAEFHRHTARKYVNELLNSGIIYQRCVGVAKLCYLKERSENQTDDILTDKPEERKIENMPNLKIVTAVIIIAFLLSETAIFAYQNTSLLNETNISGFEIINTSPLTESNSPNLTQHNVSVLNIPSDENTSLSIIDVSTEKNDFGLNQSVENFNISVQEINETLQETKDENQSIIEPISNISETLNDTQKTPVNLEIKLNYPEKITRGEIITAIATVTNIGSSTAKNVVVGWKMPDGFEIVSENEKEFCGVLGPSDACITEISIKTDISTVLGSNEIKVVVNYEE